ncbi:ribose import ATP-binding protein RbsA [Spirochaetia bacterium]|nr:ribose import ATP-binding protein RbsA [Spirochaetia bacterium]
MDNSNEYAISLEHIYKSFGSVTVLKDVNFYLKKGTIQALVGGNGAGKSTLMKIMTGVHACDSGTIKIDGRAVKIDNTIDAQKHGIKMIFQELSLSPTMTVTENIFLSNEIKKGILLDKKAMAEKTRKLLEELEIQALPTDRIQDLGVGICQLIEIIKALAVDAKILIMDEPTASLTEKETNILFGIIENLKKKGVSIVFISHRMKDIFRIVDSITVLRDGGIVADKPKSEYTLDSLIELMIGRNVEKKMEFIKRETPVGNDILMQVENLSVGKQVHGVSFAVRRGEVLGIAGLLGSGRTETLEALFGIRKGKYNKLVIDKREIVIKNVSSAIHNGIALIPEDRRRQGLVLDHSVKDNLCLPNLKELKRGIKIHKAKVKTMTTNCVESLGIKTDGVNVGMLSLSGGNQQKVVIAKWLETNPKLLLMDEPTAGVDVVAKGEIIDIIRNFVTKGNSVLFVSSETSEMMAICDRILVYSAGRIAKEFYRENLESEEMLEYAIQH